VRVCIGRTWRGSGWRSRVDMSLFGTIHAGALSVLRQTATDGIHASVLVVA
jgi:hypothetical protein